MVLLLLLKYRMGVLYPAIGAFSQQRVQQQRQVSVQLQLPAEHCQLLSVQEAGGRRVAAVELGLQLGDIVAVLHLLHRHTSRSNTPGGTHSTGSGK